MMEKHLNNANSINSESRRKFVRGLSVLVGSTAATVLLSGKSLSVAMAHSLESNNISLGDPISDGQVFKLTQLQQLKSICAIVIPKTDTLGAAEVNTHGFIDNQLYHCYADTEQEKIKKLLILINDVANQQFSLSFISLNPKQQFEILTELDLGKNNFNDKQRSDFKSLKQLICFGYYTSEVGASKELRYLAIPGGYQGSVPYKSSDSSWGSQGLNY
jgi:hypothetical protein